MTAAPPPPAEHEARMRRAHQGMIEAEMRASRRAMLSRFRERLRTDAGALASADFLAIADRAVLLRGILIAARGVAGADACDVQRYNPATKELHVVAHEGLPADFLDYFASVEPETPSACATALATGDPVFVDDVAASSIFAGRPSLPVMLAAGTRAVHSYPLHDERGALLGVLSLHYRVPGRHPGQEPLAWAAARAMARFATLTPPAIAAARTARGIATVTVRGPLDAATAPDCADVAHRALTGLGAGEALVLDLRRVDFVAAAGARAVFDAAELSAARGVRCYVLAGRDDDARAILARLGPPPTLRIVADASGI